ncbi:gamma carbonic anhydrase family protein [Methanocella sp. CWC-04]|uniref:Gamma carbonic anhydrase family protein n=1 Tax=Methanooceanicella nereidis TaxID=2052831 RepID=A0AAP2W6I2_9EURY|nr:gamma carbonic anhydrase family protein [Methanocella sp. CWC-04]MCD1295363.1 gamma carbonic anhydrase family protein [Methanocella sp. CWC-04]
MIFEHFAKPKIADSAFVAETAAIIGDVEVGEESSIWYGAVLRGDMSKIIVEKKANIQDNVVIHSAPGEDVVIGEGVTIGHCAVIHGCTIGKYSLIGMGAVVLSKAEIGENCIIGAGAVVKENDKIPPGSLVVGIPGKVVRQLTPEQMRYPVVNCEEYVGLSRKYLNE